MKDINKIERNPLSIALGVFFARERNMLRETSKEISAKIGIGDSFYRMIEAGSANLHPSRVLQTIKAFPNSGIELDALCKILVAVQMIETNLSTFDLFKQAINDLSKADAKFERLLKIFDPVIRVMQNGSFDVNDLIDNEITYIEVREFLTNYQNYASTTKEIAETKYQGINVIFDELPTIYFDYVEDFIHRTRELPVRIIFSDLWKWEEKNRKNFRSMYCISKDHRSVTDFQNLKRYKYRQLWENQFVEANFIFLDSDINAVKIKKLFETNLKKSLKESNETDKLTDYDSKVGKVRFKTCDGNNELAIQALRGLDFDAEEEQKPIHEYDAIWVFTFTNNNNVGFLASINVNNVKLKEGISLNHKNTMQKLDLMKTLWESLK